MSKSTIDWATRIKRFRDRTGEKQQAFADRFDVDRTTVARWESGRIVPHLAHREKLLELTADTSESIIARLIDSMEFMEGYATLLDGEFRILRTTRQHQRKTGLSPAEIYGKPSEPFWPEQMQKVIKQIGGIRGFRTSRIRHMDLAITHPTEAPGAQPIITVGRTVTYGDLSAPSCFLTTARFLGADEPVPPSMFAGGDGDIPLDI